MPDSRRTHLAVAIARDGRPKYQISAAARITPGALGGIISGRVTPTPPARTRLSEVLGVAEADLFPEEQS